MDTAVTDKLNAARQWREHAKYCDGIADGYRRLLELHKDSLSVDVKEWLYGEMESRREESIKNLDQAISLVK